MKELRGVFWFTRVGKEEDDDEESIEGKWWKNWELLPILILAICLRLYRLDVEPFMHDQVAFYRMAHDSFSHGLWPISGNRASVGPLIPPLFVYFMIIPALLSKNPLMGNLFIAFISVASVLLTYIFATRYYGRLVGTVSALLYATAVNVLIYSRNIWQPNVLPFFVLFFLFALFRGVVEKKRGWFVVAVLLLCVTYQFHTSAIYLTLPLLGAVFLSWKTIRKREYVYALCGCLILILPFLFLQIITQFRDFKELLVVAQHPSLLDRKSLNLYRLFVQTIAEVPRVNGEPVFGSNHFYGNHKSLLSHNFFHLLKPLMKGESFLMPFILVASAVFLILLIFAGERGRREEYGRSLKGWWRGYLASPYRQGLTILFLWQIAALLMIRHTTELYLHYLTFLLPGPFLLLGLLTGKLYDITTKFPRGWAILSRGAILLIIVLCIFVQTVGSTLMLLDRARGNFRSNISFPEYFDLGTLQHVVEDADHLAQEQHLTRIYMLGSYPTAGSLAYLAQFTKTPISVVDQWHCLLLPSVSAGPVLFVSDQNPVVDTILRQYATIDLLKEVPHPGGKALRILKLQARSTNENMLALRGDLRNGASNAQIMSNSRANQSWLVTHWQIAQNHTSAPRTNYGYQIQIARSKASKKRDQFYCGPTSTWAGDQLFSYEELNDEMYLEEDVQVRIASFITRPETYNYAGINFVTFAQTDSAWQSIANAQGQEEWDLPLVRKTIDVVRRPG